MAFESTSILTLTISIILLATAHALLKQIFGRKSTALDRTSALIYEDEDGQATQWTQNAYSHRPHKIATNVLIFVGLCVAFAGAIRVTKFSNGDKEESFTILQCWIRVAAWLFLFTQTTLFFHQRPFIDTFRFGVQIALSLAALLLNLLRESYDLLLLYQHLKAHMSELTPGLWLITGGEIGTQVLIGILAMICSLGVPRRPMIFFDGQVVDGQYTVSALSRYTYAWVIPTYARARRQLQLELRDLPTIDFVTRAKGLQSRFYDCQKLDHELLLTTLFRGHRKTVFWVACLTVMCSIAAYAPHFCLYRTLSLLESQQQTGTAASGLWLWAFGQGFTVFTQQYLNTRLEWTTVTLLEIPVRSQLSAIIFQKSIFMKEIKGSRQSASEIPRGSSDHSRSRVELGSSDTKDGEVISLLERSHLPPPDRALQRDPSAPKSPSERSDPAVLNLISIDAARVADFCCRCHVLLSSVVMFCIATTALVHLLGWISLGVGLVTAISLLPLNYKVSKSYAKSQAALMKYRDERCAAATDALLGIRQIKFSATESWWQQKIMNIRDAELRQQRWVFVWIIGLRLYWITSPIVFSLASFSTYIWINGSLSASVAFTAVGVFASLELALSSVPFVVSQLLETLVSCKRIGQHIYEAEKPPYLTPAKTIKFENATLTWPTNDKEYRKGADFVLSNVSASVPRGKFSVIHGKSGSGKTLLLNSIIGEAELISGKVYAPKSPVIFDYCHDMLTPSSWILQSSTAYCAQIPWLENATIRENILFGLPFNVQRYEKAVAAANLREDLETLDQGDMTEIGSQGINVSGGQRFRIALAKALYSRAEILVMDDIFSAVDARVGRHILEFGLLGDLCTNRTIILATHHISLCLPRADHSIRILDNGEVQETPLEQIKIDEYTMKTTINGSHHGSDKTEARIDPCDLIQSSMKKHLVEEEFRESGVVKWYVYDRYIKIAGGWNIWTLALAVIAGSQAALIGRGLWMNFWTRSSQEQTDTSEWPGGLSYDNKKHSYSMNFYLVVYIIISLSAAMGEALKCAVVYVAALRASRQLFEQLIHTVLRAPMRWLDTTPLGRILNRLTSDFVLIDTRVPGDVHVLFSALLALAATAIAGLGVTWWMVIPEVVLWATCLTLTATYLHVAQQLKRLDSVLKSPILSLFETTLAGRSTIRAYGKANVYKHLMFDHLDNLSRANWSFALTSCLLALCLGFIGAAFATAVSVTIVMRNINASLAGFVLGFSLDLSKLMDNAIRRYANLTLNMNSTERVVEFCDIETENFAGKDAPKDWPCEGRLSITSLSVGYAEHLPDAIRKLSLNIAPRERIGVVGRTGAGKSSLSLALFRILEARSGNISIDGLDISTIKLHQLRSRLAIVPQDPFLFSGTVRTNLDPVGQYSDALLQDSMNRVHLLSSSSAEPANAEKRPPGDSVALGDLDMRISEGGRNLSQGQRQLLCLARAIINRCKVMLMDEATSSVDMHTDALIQSSIQKEFRQSTLIVIAHRLSTVAGFDKILVMSEGSAVEFDTPRNLMKRKGDFYKLVEASGEIAKVQAMIEDSSVLDRLDDTT